MLSDEFINDLAFILFTIILPLLTVPNGTGPQQLPHLKLEKLNCFAKCALDGL